MLLKPENSTDTNELFECHGEYDVYQYNHGYGDVYKATMILRTLACIERLEYYLELAKGTPYGDANFIKEDIAIYKKYLNPKRKTNTYKTRDLILINRLVNELRIHIKMYLHGHHGLKKGDK